MPKARSLDARSLTKADRRGAGEEGEDVNDQEIIKELEAWHLEQVPMSCVALGMVGLIC